MYTIGSINQLCGPLWGPYMKLLLEVMRRDHGYDRQPVPSEFAGAVNGVLNVDVDTNQCPEGFAAEALAALGYDRDDEKMKQSSSQFQRRANFHFGR